jgi:hypothetical protein
VFSWRLEAPGPLVFRSVVDGPTLADMAYRFTPADRGGVQTLPPTGWWPTGWSTGSGPPRPSTWSTRACVHTPTPLPHCGACRFVAPCLAVERGQDVRAVLRAGYRDRGPERLEPGRLGAATWGTGRGAAPPRFDRG